MKQRPILMMIVAAALVVAAAVAFMLFYPPPPGLCLLDADTGELYARYTLDNNGTFSVTFRHSVNQSDVTEIYQRRGMDIWLTGCIYYNFGAGVAEVLDPSWTLEMGENGEMILGNIEKKMTDLTYVVGTVHDHVLRISGEETVLNELCGKNAKVDFKIQ